MLEKKYKRAVNKSINNKLGYREVLEELKPNEHKQYSLAIPQLVDNYISDNYSTIDININNVSDENTKSNVKTIDIDNTKKLAEFYSTKDITSSNLEKEIDGIKQTLIHINDLKKLEKILKNRLNVLQKCLDGLIRLNTEQEELEINFTSEALSNIIKSDNSEAVVTTNFDTIVTNNKMINRIEEEFK
jgi:hypothetical protein